MKKVILITCMLFSYALSYGADVNNVSLYTVTGQGRDRDEAIKSGLNIAVAQARGVKVGTGTYRFGFAEVATDVKSTEKNNKRIEFDAVSVETSGTASTTQVEGLVKSYKIISEKKLGDGNYEVEMDVWVYKLNLPASKRVKLAVMPIKTLYGGYLFGDLAMQAEKLSMLVSHEITVGLVQTGKFDVLDRDNIVDFARERNMLVAFDAPLEQQAKLIETLGADYMLIATITDAGINKTSKFIQATGQTNVDYKGKLILNYRIVSAVTKQVIFADVCEKYYEKEDLRGFSNEWSADKWDNSELRDGMIFEAAGCVSQKIIDRLYPIKIAAVDAGQVIINQGGDKFSEGMLLEVFDEGKELFDDDTRESLGKIETRKATIRIVNINPRISACEVVSGNISDLSEGMICRIVDGDILEAEPGRTTGDVIRKENGGVVLPFDKN